MAFSNLLFLILIKKMEARKPIKIKKNMSLKLCLNSFVLVGSRNNYSLKSKITQSDSTTTEEKKDFSSTKKSFFKKSKKFSISGFKGKVTLFPKNKKSLIPAKSTYKIINPGNLKNIKIRKYNDQKRNKSTRNRKTSLKKLLFANKKDIAPKQNNINKTPKINLFMKNNDYNYGGFNECYRSFLKPSPPKKCKLHKFKADLSKNNINNNDSVYKQKIPPIFLNHLLFKSSSYYNTNKDKENLQISLTKRIKSKNLTILYYRPF